MSWLMEPIYNTISWILLRWHELWDLLLPDGRFLGTNWDWVLAIVFLVVTVRLVLFPIFVKQIKSQRAMQAIAPKVKELQAKHKGDQQTLREEMMKLYQAEKVNPLMGCLPMFLQIPVFFGLFHVLSYINPAEVVPFTDVTKTLYGWTEEQFNSAAAADLFTAPIPGTFASSAEQLAALGSPGGAATKIVAAVLVLIMMFTTFATSRQMILKTGWQQDPQQRMIQKLMLYGIPVTLLLSGWYFPIGVVIYWVTQNLISLGQQQWVLRKYPPLITQPAAPATRTARERAAATTVKEPGAIKRFFLVLPPPAKAAGAQKRGWITRIIGRNKPVSMPEDLASPRSLAPRPGAKPRVRPSDSAASTPNADDTAAPDAPSAADGEPAGGGQGKAAGGPAKAAGGPAKTTGASKAAKPSATGGKPGADGKPSIPIGRMPTTGKSPTVGASPSAPAASNGGRADTSGQNGSSGSQRAAGNTSGGGRPKAAAANKSTPARRKGQTGRKGGTKR